MDVYSSQIDRSRKNVYIHEVVNHSTLNMALMTVNQHFGTWCLDKWDMDLFIS